MPFTSDGIRPDLIINPHALPSRMTIGQLVESLFGKACTAYGGFGDCTAFQTKGPHVGVYGSMLVKAGFHSSGNQILYNGMTGDQIYYDIYVGPTYYMRLKHMVKDKINYRALGPRTMLTRQTVQGRANDGGLRIGEMERDGILAHGASAFLNESFMIRGDEYYMAVCNKTGGIAIYNSSLNLFLSPFADGPIKFNTTLDGKTNIENISRFGRSFSIVRIPYALKLLIQELQTMNIQMRIITEDNIDQLVNMSYSNNINKLLKDDSEKISQTFMRYNQDISGKLQQQPGTQRLLTPSAEFAPSQPSSDDSVPYATGSPAYVPPYSSPEYNPNSPQYNPNSPKYDPNSPQYDPNSPKYDPNSPEYAPGSPAYNPNSPEYHPISSDESSSKKFSPHSPEEPPVTGINIKNAEVKTQFDSLPERDKLMLMKMVAEKKAKGEGESEKEKEETKLAPSVNPISQKDVTSILKVQTKRQAPEKQKKSNYKCKNMCAFMLFIILNYLIINKIELKLK
jgi:hypothetical protein